MILCILCVNIIIIYIYTVFEPGIEKGETQSCLGWFILVRHSNKKRDNVAKSRPGSNTVYIQNTSRAYSIPVYSFTVTKTYR